VVHLFWLHLNFEWRVCKEMPSHFLAFNTPRQACRQNSKRWTKDKGTNTSKRVGAGARWSVWHMAWLAILLQK